MKKVLFFIQGEGRGHKTQAISFYEILKSTGEYSVEAVFVGVSKTRPNVELLGESLTCPINTFISPHLANINNKEVDNFKTALNAVLDIPRYISSFFQIGEAISEYKPDLIVNFYDPLFGIYNFTMNCNCRVIHVGHQFMFLNPEYVKSQEYGLVRRAAELYTRLISTDGDRLALSFYKADDIREKNVLVVPPLIREEVTSLVPSNEGFILVYLVNNGYRNEIIEQRKLINREVHCFCEKYWPENLDTHVEGNVTFHSLNGKKFLSYMRRCFGVICTAGFETVSEAAYLGKRLVLVPVENHFEQELNALDAVKCGIGSFSKTFNLTLFDKIRPPENSLFKSWADSCRREIKSMLYVK